MTKARRVIWAGHVTRMGEKRNPYRILFGKPEERDHCEDQNAVGWKLLKWILERLDGMMWIGSIWLAIGTSGGLL
jgi:hypothetical protein